MDYLWTVTACMAVLLRDGEDQELEWQIGSSAGDARWTLGSCHGGS